MKFKKYYLFAFIGLLLVATCVGCGKEEKEEEMITGGYSISETVAGTLPENALRAFNNATNNDGKYVPLACMGTQVVAGTNYMILTKTEEKLVVLVIYEDLNQTATITNTYDFNLTDYITNNTNVTDNTNLAGGWNVPSEGNLDAMPQQLATAWSEAFLDFKEISLEPLACLGTQVVAGTNYAMLARGTLDGETLNLYMVIIYNDLDNNASVTSASQIDLTKINTNK